MNILFVIKDFSYNGGGERMLANLACSLKYKNISILSLDKEKNDILFKLNDRIQYKCANIEKRKINIFTKIDYFKYLKTNKNYLNSFDLIIGVGIIPNIIISIVKPYIKTNIIAWEHSCYKGVTLYQKILRSLYFKRFSAIVILTQRDKKKYSKVNKNIRVIYNFTSMKPDCIDNKKNDKTFLYVGRLTKQKGAKYLIKIIKEFCKRNNDWNIKIIGDGNYSKKLDMFIKKNNLCKRVIHEKINMNIEKELKKASCIIMTSLKEGLPMILIEGVTYGVPAISFDAETGPSEIIVNNENGYLVKIRNTIDFVDKMLYFSSNPEIIEYFSKMSIERSKLFTPESIIEKWNDLFETVLKERNNESSINN